MSGWIDLLVDAGHTCYPSSGNPSRIDVVFANRGARSWIRAARVRWDLGIATHAALQIDLEVGSEEQARMRDLRQPLAGAERP
eukprot:328435-Lingulodinium_polyedra.AAC.1